MLQKGAIQEAENFKKIRVNSVNSSNFIIGIKGQGGKNSGHNVHLSAQYVYTFHKQ